MPLGGVWTCWRHLGGIWGTGVQDVPEGGLASEEPRPSNETARTPTGKSVRGTYVIVCAGISGDMHLTNSRGDGWKGVVDTFSKTFVVDVDLGFLMLLKQLGSLFVAF